MLFLICFGVSFTSNSPVNFVPLFEGGAHGFRLQNRDTPPCPELLLAIAPALHSSKNMEKARPVKADVNMPFRVRQWRGILRNEEEDLISREETRKAVQM
jgi:hypothetical protein